MVTNIEKKGSEREGKRGQKESTKNIKRNQLTDYHGCAADSVHTFLCHRLWTGSYAMPGLPRLWVKGFLCLLMWIASRASSYVYWLTTMTIYQPFSFHALCNLSLTPPPSHFSFSFPFLSSWMGHAYTVQYVTVVSFLYKSLTKVLLQSGWNDCLSKQFWLANI